MLANENLATGSNAAGFIRVYNGGGFVAYFALAYYLSGNLVIKRSPAFTLGLTRTITIPQGATNIQFSASVAVFWSSWKTVCRRSFTSIPAKCYRLTGTTWYSECDEIPCNILGNGIPTMGNTPNGCNCCCCNNRIC